MSVDVGARLKTIRKMHCLSQRELAKRAGVTNGTISLIEQNRVSPSVSSLRKVLSGIPMSLGEFFATDFSATPKVFFESDELTDLGDGQVRLRLVAGDRRERAMALAEISDPVFRDELRASHTRRIVVPRTETKSADDTDPPKHLARQRATELLLRRSDFVSS